MRLEMAGWPPEAVSGYAEASRIYEERRDESGEGASTFDDGAVRNDQGAILARISYNGRVWAPGPYDPDAVPIWDNRADGEA